MKRPGQRGFVRQLARQLARKRVRSRATGRRRKIGDPLAYAATVERRRLGRPNPAIAIFGNRPRGVTIARDARQLEYTDPAKGRSTWYHKFGRGVRVTGQPDGSVRLSKPGARLWSPDGRGQHWLENSGPKPAGGRHMAKRRRTHKRRPPAGYRTWRAYMAHIRGLKNRPKRKRGSSMARRRRNDPDPGRRRRRRHNARVRHRARRHNPPAGRFLREIMPAAMDGIGITVGKVGARGLPQLVGLAPAGLLGLGVQTLSGLVVAGVVHFFAPRFAVNMIRGTFSTLYDSLGRTPVAGKPIPIIGTALADYGEAYRLAGYSRAMAPRAIGAYSRAPTAVSRGGVARAGIGRTPGAGRLVYVGQ